MVLRRQLPICLGLLAAACLHSVRPAGESLHSPEVLDVEPSASGSRVGDEKEDQRSAPRKELDLRKFRPLLAEPALSDVAAHVQAERHIEAASALEEIVSEMDRVDAATEVKPRRAYQYLAGLLHKKAGDWAQAVQRFEEAAASAWVLRDDALVHTAEIFAAQGKANQVVAKLDSLVSLQSSPGVLRLRAKGYEMKGDHAAAEVQWRKLISVAEDPEAHLGLAEALLGQAESGAPGEARKSLFRKAVKSAWNARSGLSDKDSVTLRSTSLVARVRASFPQVVTERALPERLSHLKGLVDLREFEDVLAAAAEMDLSSVKRFSSERCRFDYYVAKSLAGLRKWGEAADKLGSSAEGCTEDKELHAWLLFNAGKYNAADGRHTKAIRFYADLERLYPKNSLADDARLRAAKSYKRQGVAARFISMLQSLPEDYPEGDMSMEGVLLLAMHRMERDDWSGASQVLRSAANVVRSRDSARGHEHAGTERYFLARCQQKLGQEEKALTEFEAIVREVPLSYYMLHAYSRLLDADPKRAKAALSEGLRRAKESPFHFPHRPEYETEGFRRGMELLRVGEFTKGQQILAELGLGEGADDSLLWGIALLYDRAGDAHRSHGIARGRLTDWFAHYPEGDWKSPWEIGFPRPYHSIVQKESEATGVPQWFIYGIMREESTFRPRVVSHANAYGLMQIIVPTARGIGKKAGLAYTPAALKRPKTNIAIGSRVLKELGRRFRTNPWLAIPGYNAGPGRPARWLRERPNTDFDIWVEMIPYRETRRYTKRVLASRAAYAFLYQRKEAQTALVLPKRLTPP